MDIKIVMMLRFTTNRTAPMPNKMALSESNTGSDHVSSSPLGDEPERHDRDEDQEGGQLERVNKSGDNIVERFDVFASASGLVVLRTAARSALMALQRPVIITAGVAKPPVPDALANTSNLSTMLFSTFVYPFELTSF